MDHKDWTLLTIAAAEGEPIGPAQLQKSLFVLGRERRYDVGSGFHEFQTPGSYGPNVASVYLDARALEKERLVTINRPDGVSMYRATPRGMMASYSLAKESQDTVRYLGRVVSWARDLSFQALVRAIYAKYPEQRENSVFPR